MTIEKWNDKSLDQLEATVAAVGTSVGQVVVLGVKTDQIVREMRQLTHSCEERDARLQKDLKEAREEMSTIKEEIEHRMERRADTYVANKNQRTVAWIAAGALVFGQIITTIAVLLK